MSRQLHIIYLALIFALAPNFAPAARDTEPQYNHVCPASGDYQNKLLIHHIAVGQGDSTFIRTPQGLTILIDAGLRSMGNREIVPLLKDCYHLSALDYVILTHYDIDHHGGMPEVLAALSVNKAVYDPGDEHLKSGSGEQAQNRYLDAARATHKRHKPALGMGAFEMPAGDLTDIEVITVDGEVLENRTPVEIMTASGNLKNDNAISIATTFRFGTFDYWIGGDLTGGGMSTPDLETPAARVVGRMDVLHADHHGSNTSNNQFFLDTLQPVNVMISVGVGGTNGTRNSTAGYHLPGDESLARMQALASILNIYQTSEGASQARPAAQRKVRNMESDIVVIAEQDKYKVVAQGHSEEFPTDGVTARRRAGASGTPATTPPPASEEPATAPADAGEPAAPVEQNSAQQSSPTQQSPAQQAAPQVQQVSPTQQASPAQQSPTQQAPVKPAQQSATQQAPVKPAKPARQSK